MIRINGLETFYQLDGQGDPVVLLHGWGASSQSLSGVAACLAPIFRVLSVDLPGFGWSQAPPVAWGVADYADHVRQLLDEAQIERAALLGHSFGGRIAIRLASGDRDRGGSTNRQDGKRDQYGCKSRAHVRISSGYGYDDASIRRRPRGFKCRCTGAQLSASRLLGFRSRPCARR